MTVPFIMVGDRMKFRIWYAVGISVILLAAILSVSLVLILREGDREIEVHPLDHLSDIAISTESGVVRYHHDNSTNTFVEDERYGMTGINGVDRIGQDIVVNHGKGLTLLDGDLKPIKQLAMAPVKDIAIYDGTIFCCSNSSLVAVSSDLDIVSSLFLNISNYMGTKDAHDILIYDGSAFLLDNIVEPLWVFKVDVSNPAAMKEDLGFEITSINQHLKTQWIDPATDRWFIVQYLAYMGGTDEYILTYSVDNGTLMREQEIYSDPWSNGPMKGFVVQAATETSPGWVLTQSDDAYQVRPFKSDGDRAEFGKKVPVKYGDEPGWGKIERSGDLLFVTTYDQVIAVDVSGDPTVALVQTFPEPIVDLVVI